MDNLIGLKENVIIGKLVPAGTGMKCYSDVEIQPEGGPEDDGPKEEKETLLNEELPEDTFEDEVDLEEEDLFNEEDGEEAEDDVLEEPGA